MNRLFLSILFFSTIFFIFRNWFGVHPIIGGDWPYFFDETLRGFGLFPPVWSPLHGGGMGGIIPNYLLDVYLYNTVFIFFNLLQIPWVIVYKIFWFGLFLFLSIFSPVYLIKTISIEPRAWQVLIGALLYCTNTYILMVVGGGQMGIALAYSIAPLVLSRFIKLVNYINSASQDFQFSIRQLADNYKLSIIAGLVLAVQFMFDPRIPYLVVLSVVAYYLLDVVYRRLQVNQNSILSMLIYIIAIPVGITFLLHMQWILPLIFFKVNLIPQGLQSIEGFRFFSFADFSHAFSLLHPNWPENIFGKTYFLRPEFLFIPILAYSSLLFINSKRKTQSAKLQLKSQNVNRNLTIEQFNNKTILFFALLGLMGTFLAKGVNPPFGEINEWLFNHVFGMNLFRDPTKFYLLIALSYSMLIPFSLHSIQELIRSKIKDQKSKIPAVFLLFTILYLIFLIRPAILNQLGGTFKRHEIPKEYIELKDFLNTQPEFFRTLWFPKQSRFSFVSNTHPAVEAMPLFNATSSAELISFLKNPNTQKYLSSLAIKYIIIPYDSLGEFFLEDRKYNEKERTDLEESLDRIGWLKKQKEGRITLYEAPSYQDHFSLESSGKLSYRMINSSLYTVSISTIGKNNLIFSENFNPYWVAKINSSNTPSVETREGLNSFALPTGEYSLEVYYSPEQYYSYGRVISLVTLCIVIITIFMIKSKNYAV